MKELGLSLVLVALLLTACGKREVVDAPTEPTKSATDIASENVVQEYDYYIDSLGIVHLFTIIQNNSDKTLDVEYAMQFYTDGNLG